MMTLPPLTLYIHTPWCVRKCPYCDFNSHQVRGEIPQAQYLQALIDELQQKLAYIQARPITAIFIGGGTPSLMTPEFYERLFTELKKHMVFANDIEITMEANPGTVEQQRFIGFREVGINRLSIGIQSFQDEKLQALGRIHDSKQADRAVMAAKAAGFSNFNLDLMFGLPKQSIEDGLFDLQTAIAYQPTHLSWYQLTLEPNTYFSKYPPSLPDEDVIIDMHNQGQALLAKKGFVHYEVSAFAKADFQCRHNRNYWLFGDYLGLGAGAHSKITLAAKQQIERHWNIKHPTIYLEAHNKIVNQKVLTTDELPVEFFMNTLRLHEPIEMQLFEERTGQKANTIIKQLQTAEEQGLLRLDHNTIYINELGKRFLNEILINFM